MKPTGMQTSSDDREEESSANRLRTEYLSGSQLGLAATTVFGDWCALGFDRDALRSNSKLVHRFPTNTSASFRRRSVSASSFSAMLSLALPPSSFRNP